LQLANFHSLKSDLILTLGSSLLVKPACLLPIRAKKNGSKLVIVNLQPTPFDSIADLRINGKVDDVI
jgi:NAD-dependent SIR2 family protein deacetylase